MNMINVNLLNTCYVFLVTGNYSLILFSHNKHEMGLHPAGRVAKRADGDHSSTGSKLYTHKCLSEYLG